MQWSRTPFLPSRSQRTIVPHPKLQTRLRPPDIRGLPYIRDLLRRRTSWLQDRWLPAPRRRLRPDRASIARLVRKPDSPRSFLAAVENPAARNRAAVWLKRCENGGCRFETTDRPEKAQVLEGRSGTAA